MSEANQSQADLGQSSLNQVELKQEQTRLKSLLLDHYHCTFFLPIVNDSENQFPASPLDEFRHSYVVKDESVTQSSEAADKLADAQAYHFFNPSIRKILFDQGETQSKTELTPMHEWRLPQELIKQWELTLHKNDWAKGDENDPLNKQEAIFKSVKLYRYFNNNYVLAFQLVPKALNELHEMREDEILRLSKLAENKEKTPGDLMKLANEQFGLFQKSNKDKVDAQTLEDFKDDPLYQHYKQLQLEAWLRFSRLVRQLYPSFTEQGEEGKIAPISFSQGQGTTPENCFDEKMTPGFPKHIGEQLSPIVKQVLLAFFAPKKHPLIERWLKHSLNLYDDRMFISVAYSLAGAKHDERTLQLINTLAATTDRVDDCWVDFDNQPYSPSALGSYLEGCQFNFWKDIGGTYSYTDMVNAYVSCGRDFRDMIAPIHIPAIYDRMMVQALFYQASLRFYDHAITNKTSQLISKRGADKTALDMTEMLGQFIRFTNQYWFAEVTNQMQGKAIFALQLRGLNVSKHFDQLQDEIDRSNDYVHAEFERRQTEKADKLSKLGIVIAVIALVPVINDVFKTELSLWTSLAHYLGESKISDDATHTFTVIRWSIAVALTVISASLAGWFMFSSRRKR